MDIKILQVLDRLIPYDTFLNDLAARIVKMMKADNNDPEFVSQRKAYHPGLPQDSSFKEQQEEPRKVNTIMAIYKKSPYNNIHI